MTDQTIMQNTPVDYVRKPWFRAVKKIVGIFIHAPRFIYLGEKPGNKCIILSNHEGTSVPLKLELYSQLPIRFWGAGPMNHNFSHAYRYQTKIYYHQKKHWNLWLARLFCLLATPLTRMFYIGLDLISTYPDARFSGTLKKSVAALKKNHTVVIFPEDSSDGYLKELKGFHQGSLMLLELCRKQGLDVPVYVAYYNKQTKQHIFDAPVTVSQLLDQGLDRAQLAQKLCDRCNELGRMTFES